MKYIKTFGILHLTWLPYFTYFYLGIIKSVLLIGILSVVFDMGMKR